MTNELQVLLDDEELPTDEQPRYVVGFLSKEEQLRIADLQSKIQSLLESGTLTNEVSERLDNLFAFLERLSSNINEMRSYYEDGTLSSINNKVSDIAREIEAIPSFSDKVDSYMEKIESKSGSINGIISSLDLVKDDIQSAVSDLRHNIESSQNSLADFMAILSNKLDNIEKTSVNEIREELINNENNRIEIKTSIEALRKEISVLAGKIENVDTKTNSFEDIKEQIADLGKDIRDKINTTLNTVKTELKETNNELLLQKNDALQDIENRMNESLGHIKDYMNRNAERMDENAGKQTALETTLKDISSIHSQIDSRFNSIESMRAVIDEAAARISSSTPLLESISSKLETATKESANLLAAHKTASDAVESAAKAIEEDMKEAAKHVDRKTDDILNVLMNRITRLESIIEKLEKTYASETSRLENISSRIASVPRARTPKRRPAPKKRPRIRLRQRRVIEDEALDLLIIDTLRNVSMNISSLENATNVGETRLRRRLSVLISRGVIIREKRGRSIYYTTRTEQIVL